MHNCGSRQPGRCPIRAIGLCGVLAAAALLPPAAVTAAGVKNPNPYWFEDSYRTLGYVDMAATTAIMDNGGTGTAYLPPLSADDLAYAPPYVGADILEVGTASGVQGWGFNGAAMISEPFLDVAATDPAGVAFLGQAPPGEPGQGVRLAVAAGAGISIYGWNGVGWASVLNIAAPGIVGVAAGADGGVLAATAGGFTLYSPAGVQQTQVTGLSGLVGVTSAAGGMLVAVWTNTTASFYSWTGAQYMALPSWGEPEPAAGSLLGVAFFRGGGGYWLATPTQVVAYGWNGAVLAGLPGWGSSAMPAQAVAVATGWGPGSVSVLSPAGAQYLDAPGGALGVGSARSIVGQSWAVFAASGMLGSAVLPVGHNVDEVRMVDTMAALPTGTALGYRVSTDGGATWTNTPPLTPTNVPAGDALVYQAALSTTDTAQTPVLDTTDLYEIATETQTETQAVSWLLG